MKETEVAEAVKHAFDKVKGAELSMHPRPTHGPDLIMRASIKGRPAVVLICEIKAEVHPKQTRQAVEQLKHYASQVERSYPVLIADYMTQQSKEICEEEGVGFIELFSGACLLAFDLLHIERPPADLKKAKAENRRYLRSVFGLKSARLMRLLLRNPSKLWRVTNLAREARVSVGQVSNVRRFLIEQEWASADRVSNALKIDKPGKILDAWRDVYGKSRPQRTNYYTVLHGRALDDAIREALVEAGEGKKALLSSYSAAKWIAPYARYTTERLLAKADGEAILERRLQLESTVRGENVSIERPKDEAVFDDRLEAAPGMWCTGLVQTYLDLWLGGSDRGQEAAEHLRRMKIEQSWQLVSPR